MAAFVDLLAHAVVDSVLFTCRRVLLLFLFETTTSSICIYSLIKGYKVLCEVKVLLFIRIQAGLLMLALGRSKLGILSSGDFAAFALLKAREFYIEKCFCRRVHCLGKRSKITVIYFSSIFANIDVLVRGAPLI